MGGGSYVGRVIGGVEFSSRSPDRSHSKRQAQHFSTEREHPCLL